MIQQHQHFELYDKLLLEKVVLVPPFKTPGIMDNEACFLYAVQGHSRIFSEHEEHQMQAQEGVVMKCGNYLNEWLADQEGTFCEAIAVHFYPEVLKKIYSKELPEFIQKVAKTPPVAIQPLKATRLLKSYVDSLQFYFENPELVSDELLQLKVKELILLLAKTDNSSAIQQLFSSLFHPAEYSFKKTIEHNIFSNLSNEELAMLTNQSLSSFKREFDKIYGISPAKFFKHRRLERAADLLRSTRQRIGNIAFDCGFKEISHFSKSFQQVYGKSPSQYRQED